jgi:hypothetical protein
MAENARNQDIELESIVEHGCLKEGAAFCEGHHFLPCRGYQAILSSFKRDEEYKKPRNTAAPVAVRANAPATGRAVHA